MKYIAGSICFIAAGINGIAGAMSNIRATATPPVACCLLAGLALIAFGIYEDIMNRKK